MLRKIFTKNWLIILMLIVLTDLASYGSESATWSFVMMCCIFAAYAIGRFEEFFKEK